MYDPGDHLFICKQFCEGAFDDIIASSSSFLYDPGPFRLSALMVWGLLVGSPLYECPLPLPSTTSVLKAHDVQASQDMKLKLDSSHFGGFGSLQLFSDQLMTYSSLRV